MADEPMDVDNQTSASTSDAKGKAKAANKKRFEVKKVLIP